MCKQFCMIACELCMQLYMHFKYSTSQYNNNYGAFRLLVSAWSITYTLIENQYLTVTT